MSDRDRLLDAAIRIGLIALILMGGVILAPMALRVLNGLPAYPGHSTNDAEDASTGGDAPLQSGVEGEGAVQTQTAEERAEARDKADVEAQQSMARAAWRQVAVGAAGLLGLGLTIGFAFLAWREAKRSADLAERELTVVRKPRFELTADGPLFWDGNRPHVHVLLQNTGGSRALLETNGQCEVRYSTDPADILRLLGSAGVIPESAATTPFSIVDTPLVPEQRTLVLLSGMDEMSPDQITRFRESKALIFFLAEFFYVDHLDVDRVLAATIMCGGRTSGVIGLDDYPEEQDSDATHRRRRRAFRQ